MAKQTCFNGKGALLITVQGKRALLKNQASDTSFNGERELLQEPFFTRKKRPPSKDQIL